MLLYHRHISRRFSTSVIDSYVLLRNMISDYVLLMFIRVSVMRKYESEQRCGCVTRLLSLSLLFVVASHFDFDTGRECADAKAERSS